MKLAMRTLSFIFFIVFMIALFLVTPGKAASNWYVAPGGLDANSCSEPAAPCATVNGALAKAITGDTILIGEGIYNVAGDEVVIDKISPFWVVGM